MNDQDLQQARATIESLIQTVAILSQEVETLRDILRLTTQAWKADTMRPAFELMRPVPVDQFSCTATHCDHENQSI